MNRQFAALILNIAAFTAGVVGIVIRFVRNPADFFLYYTQLSNVAAVISSAIYIVCRDSADERVKRFVRCARYLGVCGLTMTFVVVTCIFMPFSGGSAAKQLFGSVNGVLHHAVCPVISVASYLFLEEGVKSRKAVMIPFIFTAIYAFTLYTLNFMRLAKAPYPFFDVYAYDLFEIVIWFFALMGLAAGIAFAVRAVNNSVNKRRRD